jgi:hypothetical protein
MIITEDHIALLRRMRFDFTHEIECGAVTTDDKRPFGNGDVPGDICDILGIEHNRDADDCPVSWTDARRWIAELSAVVDHLVHSQADLDSLIGHEVAPPWRARQYLAKTVQVDQ